MNKQREIILKKISSIKSKQMFAVSVEPSAKNSYTVSQERFPLQEVLNNTSDHDDDDEGTDFCNPKCRVGQNVAIAYMVSRSNNFRGK